jgi:hypothetical protein
MRDQYLVRFANGSRHTVACLDHINGEAAYVDQYTGQVVPSAIVVHRLGRPEWCGDAVSAASAECAVPLRVAMLLKLAAYRALGRASGWFRLPQRGVAALAGGHA